MRIRTALYVLLGVLLLVFVLANWNALATPIEINLLVATLSAPVAVIGLVVLAAFIAIDWGVHSVQRMNWARERRALKLQVDELRAQAEDIEASRLRALQDAFERETTRIRDRLDTLIERQARPDPAPTRLSIRES